MEAFIFWKFTTNVQLNRASTFLRNVICRLKFQRKQENIIKRQAPVVFYKNHLLQDFLSVSDHFGTFCIKGLTIPDSLTSMQFWWMLNPTF